MPAFKNVFTRSDDDSIPSSAASGSESISSPTILAGIIVAAVIALGLLVWFALRLYRKRARNRRAEKMGAAFLSVKGIVKDDPMTQRSPAPFNAFSREKLDASVVLPQRARLAHAQTAEDVIHTQRGSEFFPRPFSAKYSFSVEPPRDSILDPAAPPGLRSSFMSSYSQNRFSVMSSTSSFNGSVTLGAARKVRQVYDPVLPDELLIRLGEQLTVIQSFDDGWCVVGREGGSLLQTAKSLFKPASVAESDVELGVVPAWCFLKPVKGLRAERPVRSSSLGITVNINAPDHADRGALVSWSNF